MHYPDLRAFLESLDATARLRRIKRTIRKETELIPLVRWQYDALTEEERRPFLFENVIDAKGYAYNSSVLVSLLGTDIDYALALKCRPAEIKHRWFQALSKPIEPVLVADGAVQEKIFKGSDLKIGLDEFPIPISTPGYDPVPYLTGGCVISKDAESGNRNLGTYRVMILGERHAAIPISPGQDIFYHWQTARRIKKTLEVAIVIGAAPVVSMVSGAKLGYEVDELAVAGGLAGEAIPLVKCQTVNLEVPAMAEIVIEGIINLDRQVIEGPFGSFNGFISKRSNAFLLEITAITHRHNPILQVAMGHVPPNEVTKIMATSWEAMLEYNLKKDYGIKGLHGVAVNERYGQSYAVLSMESNPFEAWRALEAVAAQRENPFKIVIAVDEDVDPRQADSLNWALCFRMQPHKDTKVVMQGIKNSMKFISKDDENGAPSVLLINSLRKWAYTPVSLPSRELMEHAQELWIEEGLPSLNPIKPWYGYELGDWNDENREEASLAVAGQWQKTSEKLASRRVKLGANLQTKDKEKGVIFELS